MGTLLFQDLKPNDAGYSNQNVDWSNYDVYIKRYFLFVYCGVSFFLIIHSVDQS